MAFILGGIIAVVETNNWIDYQQAIAQQEEIQINKLLQSDFVKVNELAKQAAQDPSTTIIPNSYIVMKVRENIFPYLFISIPLEIVKDI